MDDETPVRGAWIAVGFAALTAAAGAVAGCFLLKGAWPVGAGIGVVALGVTLVLGTVTAITCVATTRD